MDKPFNIFVDLDETLWHSTTRMYMENRRLLPDSLCELTGPEYIEERNKAIKGMEKRAEEILDDKGLVDGTFEYEVARSGALDEAFIELCVRNGWKEYWIGEEWYVNRLRPGAEQFLIEASAIGNVYVCTSSTFEYATGLLEVHGLKAYFEGMITREGLNSKMINPLNIGINGWVLVDDLPPYAESMAKKMFHLAGIDRANLPEISKHLVQVPEWTGDPTSDALVGLAAGIKERFGSLVG